MNMPMYQQSTVHAKETYGNVEQLFHKRVICVDLKMANFLLGLQGGSTKYPCFPYLWNSCAKYRH